MTPAAGRVLADAPIAGFGHDTWWLVVIKVVGIFVFLVLTVLICIWAERRIVGRMQHRLGPNRVGPFGLLQSLADGVKLALKEDVIPDGADRIVFVLAPVVAAIPAFLAFAVVPFGPNVSIFGHRTQLQLTDMPVAVLYILAVASVGIYGIVLAGWSSGSTYPLLGGLRSSAQMISYEVAMGLSLVGVFIYAGSMSTSSIVAHQHHLWFVVSPLFFSFCIYLVSMVGETNRAPFDLPEAEGELVGGFHTEYSSLKFAMFFLAEYVNMCTVSALATTMFFGGWRAPWPLSLWDGANQGWWPLLWFTVKLWIFLFFFIWLRGTLPRLRYDQFMRLGWKVLIPFSLFWLVAIAAGRAIGNNYTVDRSRLLLYVGIALAVFVAIMLIPTRKKEEPVDESAQLEDFDPFAGGHPVPPMPWQQRQVVRPAVGARAGEADDE